MKRKKRSDAAPEWLRVQRVRASRARWRAKQLDAGRCPHCGRGVPIAGGECADCRTGGRAGDARTYRRRVRHRLRHDELTPAQFRALDILSDGSAWTPGRFAARMWPTTHQARVAGRVLGFLGKAGWVSRRQVGDRQAVYQLTVAGRRVWSVNRAFLEQARKQAAA